MYPLRQVNAGVAVGTGVGVAVGTGVGVAVGTGVAVAVGTGDAVAVAVDIPEAGGVTAPLFLIALHPVNKIRAHPTCMKCESGLNIKNSPTNMIAVLLKI
jgi:hypothetical protein